MSHDVIIVGLGAMGSAAAFHLARRGVKVLGLEQFDIPHSRGSSHGYSRMIRMAYYEHPHYVPLLRRAYELWHELEAISGQKLLHITGGIYMDKADGSVVRGCLEAARLHKLDHEYLSRDQIGGRFPQFSLPRDYVGVFEPTAGFLLPERVVAAHALEAMKRGAELHGHEAVLEWSAESDSVKVRTALKEYRAPRILFCGGAWSGEILRDLGVPLRVTRQVLGWLWPSEPASFAPGSFPVWGAHHPDGSLSYGFPMMDEAPGLKIARHGAGSAADADAIVRDELPGDREEVREIARRFLPSGDGPVLSLRVCMYTNSPDAHFIIDRLPGHENVTLACGFSGHGFKFASVVGEVLADLVTTGRTHLPADFLSLARFG